MTHAHDQLRRRPRTTAAAFVALVVTGALLALGLAAAPAQAADGTISGTVTNAAGGGPVAGVEVSLWTFDDEWGWEVADSTLTAAGGTYSISAPTGTYRVGFDDPCTEQSCEDDYVAQYWDNESSIDDAADVEVTSSGATTGINAALIPYSTIAGRVTDTDGAGLPSITVEVYEQDNGQWEWADNTVTEGDGTYSVRVLAGTYRVGFRDWFDEVYGQEFYDESPTLSAAQDVVVGTNVTVPGIDGSLAEGGSITGRVTRTGSAFGDACVDAFDAAGNHVLGVGTGEDGEYTLAPLASGSYRIRFEDCSGTHKHLEWYHDKESPAAANPVTVTAPGATSGIDADFPRTAACTAARTKLAAATHQAALRKAALTKAKKKVKAAAKKVRKLKTAKAKKQLKAAKKKATRAKAASAGAVAAQQAAAAAVARAC